MAERPDGQVSQLAEPSVLANDRAGQSVHAAEVSDPVSALKVPAGQLSHSVCPLDKPTLDALSPSIQSAFIPLWE